MVSVWFSVRTDTQSIGEDESRDVAKGSARIVDAIFNEGGDARLRLLPLPFVVPSQVGIALRGLVCRDDGPVMLVPNRLGERGQLPLGQLLHRPAHKLVLDF